MKKLIALMFLFVLPLFGEAFGNSIVVIPKVGTAFFDKPFSLQNKAWGISHQWTVGTSYMQALDYRWWWLVDTSFAMGSLSNPHAGAFLSSFMGGGGLRYNFMTNDIRPHAGFMLHYLQFFGDSVKKMPLDLGWPIFVGLKPFAGVEWIFASEIALLLELGYGLYINIYEPFRQVLYSHASLGIYF